MARYIDADELLKDLCTVSAPTPSESWIVEKCIEKVNEQVVADVVPKSEVDRLVDKWIGEEKLTQDEKTLRLIEALQDEAKRYERYYFNHEYDKLIAEAKQEVARGLDDLRRYILLNENIAIRCKRENGEENEEYWKGKVSAFRQIRGYIDMEFKKYTESEDKE